MEIKTLFHAFTFFAIAMDTIRMSHTTTTPTSCCSLDPSSYSDLVAKYNTLTTNCAKTVALLKSDITKAQTLLNSTVQNLYNVNTTVNTQALTIANLTATLNSTNNQLTNATTVVTAQALNITNVNSALMTTNQQMSSLWTLSSLQLTNITQLNSAVSGTQLQLSKVNADTAVQASTIVNLTAALNVTNQALVQCQATKKAQDFTINNLNNSVVNLTTSMNSLIAKQNHTVTDLLGLWTEMLNMTGQPMGTGGTSGVALYQGNLRFITTVMCGTVHRFLVCSIPNTIHIVFGSFGRTDVSCGPGSVTNCTASTDMVMDELKTMCLPGSRVCNVWADPTKFLDPCPNLVKRLTVSYVCL